MQNFNDTEALKISREIELRGADIYARALRIAKKPDVRQMLDHLRKEELEHAALFEHLSCEALSDDTAQENYAPEAAMFLSAFAAEIAFPGGLMKLAGDKGLDDPRVVLEEAIQAEKNSILFYTEVIAASHNDKLKKYLGDIVQEERGHLMGLMMQLQDMN